MITKNLFQEARNRLSPHLGPTPIIKSEKPKKWINNGQN